MPYTRIEDAEPIEVPELGPQTNVNTLCVIRMFEQLEAMGVQGGRDAFFEGEHVTTAIVAARRAAKRVNEEIAYFKIVPDRSFGDTDESVAGEILRREGHAGLE